MNSRGILLLKLHFSTCVGSKGGFLLSADLGKIVVRKRTIRQPLKKEPPVLIMQDALPLFKSFLKPVSLKQRARQLVLRCVIAFLMHLGKMSASRVAGAVQTDARHRVRSVDSWDAAIGGDAISSANCVLNCLKWKRGKGRSSSTSIKPTVASKVSSPKTRSSAAKKQSAPRRTRRTEEVRAAVVSLFRDGLADYPQRNASTVFRELLHRGLL